MSVTNNAIEGIIEDRDGPEPPYGGSEKETLLGFLDLLRCTILCKLEGLSDDDVLRVHPPSTITLLGLVKHLASVERFWFQHVFLGRDADVCWTQEDPDADWRIEPGETREGLVALYRQEIEVANRILRDYDLGHLAQRVRPGEEGMHLRWIVTHMIEETSRHCGHADLLRESIDGQTGE